MVHKLLMKLEDKFAFMKIIKNIHKKIYLIEFDYNICFNFIKIA